MRKPIDATWFDLETADFAFDNKTSKPEHSKKYTKQNYSVGFENKSNIHGEPGHVEESFANKKVIQKFQSQSEVKLSRRTMKPDTVKLFFDNGQEINTKVVCYQQAWVGKYMTRKW